MQGGKYRVLLTPGPVHVDPGRYSSVEEMHHRSDSFRTMMKLTCDLLSELACSSGVSVVISSSGTGGMEASVSNFTTPSDRVLVISSGKFGERWGEILAAFGRQSRVQRLAWEKKMDVGWLVDLVLKERPDVLFLTHVESSTGMLFPIQEFLRGLGDERPLVVVDAIASLGVEDLAMDGWGVDVIVAASQKALAVPPGLGIVVYGERAGKVMRENKVRGYFFDLERYIDEALSGNPPFTPPVPLVQMMLDSLKRLKMAGWEKVRKKHAMISDCFCEGMSAMGFRPLSGHPSNAVQALEIPDRLVGKVNMPDLIEERTGFIVADGQGEFSGRLIRTGFLGIHGGETIAEFLLGMLNVSSGLGLDCDAAKVRHAAERVVGISSVFDKES